MFGNYIINIQYLSLKYSTFLDFQFFISITIHIANITMSNYKYTLQVEFDDLDLFKQIIVLAYAFESEPKIDKVINNDKTYIIMHISQEDEDVYKSMVSQGITIRRKKYEIIDISNQNIQVRSEKCELLLFLVRYFHLLKIVLIIKNIKIPNHEKYGAFDVVTKYIMSTKNEQIFGDVCPKYQFDKFNFSCHQTNEIIYSLIFGVNETDMEIITFDDITKINMNTTTDIHLINITINVRYANQIKEDYIHFFTIMCHNGRYHLIQTFGLRHGLVLNTLRGNEFNHLIDALINIKNNDIDLLTRLTYDKYLNNELMIYNNSLITKTDDHHIFDDVAKIRVFTKIYTKSNFKCKGSSGFCCLGNVITNINNRKDTIREILGSIQPNTYISKYKKYKILKELDDFEKTYKYYESQNNAAIIDDIFEIPNIS